MIAKACELILRQALTNADDTEDGTALSLLQILEEQAHISGASLTSLLFEFPTTAAAATEPPKDGLLQTLFLFLASPARILRHIQLASWGIRLLSALCTTPNEWRGSVLDPSLPPRMLPVVLLLHTDLPRVSHGPFPRVDSRVCDDVGPTGGETLIRDAACGG